MTPRDASVDLSFVNRRFEPPTDLADSANVTADAYAHATEDLEASG